MKCRGRVNPGGTDESVGLCAILIHYPGAKVLAPGIVLLNPEESIARAANLGSFVEVRCFPVQSADGRNAGVSIASAGFQTDARISRAMNDARVGRINE